MRRRSGERLEAHAVDAVEPRGGTEPQKAVGGLVERGDVGRRAIADCPRPVLELRKGALRILAVQRGKRRRAQHARPEQPGHEMQRRFVDHGLVVRCATLLTLLAER